MEAGGSILAYDSNTHQHIDRTVGSRCFRAHGVRGGTAGTVGMVGAVGRRKGGPRFQAATRRMSGITGGAEMHPAGGRRQGGPAKGIMDASQIGQMT